MSTTTPKLILNKPDGGDLINVTTALNNNYDILDEAVLLTASQTLTNKTLTSPVINSMVIASGGLTISAGGLTVTTAGATITGGVTINNGLNVSTGNIGIGIAPSSAAGIVWAANQGDKAYLFPSALNNNYGLGINTGELVLFPAANQTVTIRDSNYNGTLGIQFTPITPSVAFGTTGMAASGAVRFTVSHKIGWRNGSNSADITLGVDTSNRVTLDGAVAIAASATAGANALPANPFGFLRVMIDGTERKIPVYNA